MQPIAVFLTELFLEKGIISEDERDIYIYGFDITLFTIISTAGLLLLGMLANRFWETSVILIIFSLFQTHGGGYHANSHLKCFLTMTFILCIGLIFTYIPIPPYAPEIAVFLSILLLLLIPLTLHPNKAYLASQSPSLKRKSRATTLLVSGITAIFVYVLKFQLLPFSFAFAISAASRAYAAWERKKSMK